MKTIVLANQKGGVAKTTSTYNLGYLKALEGNRVLMIDLDPQASLTIMCGLVPGKTELDVCQLFNPKIDPFACCVQVEASGLSDLYLVPSDIELAVTEQNLIGRTAREKLLRRCISVFSQDVDYILIDCPPQLGVLTMNGLVAADCVVVPTKAEYLSYRGVRSLKDTIRVAREEFNPSLEMAGFIITMYEKGIASQRAMLGQFEKEGDILGVVKKSADSYRDILDGKPVVMSKKWSDVSKAYQEIAGKL